MTKLRLLSAKEFERLLFYLGFQKIRQNGSHVIYKHADGRRTTIPHHVGQTISRPLARSILKDIQLEIDAFNDVLDEI